MIGGVNGLSSCANCDNLRAIDRKDSYSGLRAALRAVGRLHAPAGAVVASLLRMTGLVAVGNTLF